MDTVAVCRYCESGVPHEVCAEAWSADAPAVEAEPHVHHYLCELACDDPAYVVRDCGCGHRIRVYRDKGGKETVLNDGIIEGAGSLANVAYVQKRLDSKTSGFNNLSNWTDRWADSL
jgi:hypothetical protein